ncbi:hypothetical protein P152DRAFT_338830 [Eremomyces bilateralis CBS 781.70]|uniref:Uncharacterized protein n=1 Tax=Eremomyces bilateralis CBS 781.70 TaxID=1392243 RepID=A0A6G1G321_9PEZI|nr:uncharacterized protein P152DRAFT_338830 [Eremomyces bilateralis CBS 781.70]KAF1812443.1 hypothetical protein P152DRAFT_338830 [Eremomyces bilateralis CBS 781.70]
MAVSFGGVLVCRPSMWTGEAGLMLVAQVLSIRISHLISLSSLFLGYGDITVKKRNMKNQCLTLRNDSQNTTEMSKTETFEAPKISSQILNDLCGLELHQYSGLRNIHQRQMSP